MRKAVSVMVCSVVRDEEGIPIMASSHGPHGHHAHLEQDQRPHGGPELAKDPVCGMDVVPGRAAGDRKSVV